MGVAGRRFEAVLMGAAFMVVADLLARTIVEPAELPIGVVTDRADGKLAHLDGLNLSRAWMLQGIASGLPEDDDRRGALLAAAGPRTVVFLLGDNGSNANAFKVGNHESRYPVGHPLHQPGDEQVGFSVAPPAEPRVERASRA